MKRWMLTLLMMSCALAQAAAIDRYVTRLDIQPDGAGVAQLEVQVAPCQPGGLSLPVGFGGVDALQVLAAPQGTQAKAVAGKDASRVDILLPDGVADTCSLRLSMSVGKALGRPVVAAGEKTKLAADTQVFRHVFVNTGALPIGVYELSVALPEDRRVQKVVEQSPRPKRSEVLPRVRLDRFGEQQGATLQLAAMKQGDRTAMTLNVVPARPSYGWLLVGLLIAVAYLVGFRSLVSTSEPTGAVPGRAP